MATITILMWVPLRREGKSYHNVAIPAPIVLRTGFARRLIALWLIALWPKPSHSAAFWAAARSGVTGVLGFDRFLMRSRRVWNST